MNEYLVKVENAINEFVKSASEWLTEQSWFDDLKMRWQDLDPRSRGYFKLGAMGVGGVIAFFMMISVLSGVTGARSDYYARLEMLGTLDSATAEMKSLKRRTGMDSGGEIPTPWADRFGRIANESSIDPSAMIVGPETPGKQNELVKEGIFDLSFKNITIRQLVGFLVKLQMSGSPARLDNIEVNTVGAEGYMDAKTRVTALTVNPAGGAGAKK